MRKIPQKIFGGWASRPKAESPDNITSPISNVFSYKIIGFESQILEIDLSPFQSVRLEPGSIIYIGQGVTMNTSVGSSKKQGIIRLLSGSSLFLVDLTFENNLGSGRVALGSSYSGQILAMDMKDFPDGFLFAYGSYLCSSFGVNIDSRFSGFSTSLVMGISLQKFSGESILS